MYLAGDVRCRASTLHGPGRPAARCPTTPRACGPGARLRQRAPARAGPDVLERAALVVDIDHHHDNTRFGGGQPRRRRRILDRRDPPRPLRRARRQAHPAIAEALYIALVTDTGAVPVSRTRRRRRSVSPLTSSRRAPTYTASSRASTRSVAFAKLSSRTGARARAGPRGRLARHLGAPAQRLRTRSARRSPTRRESSTTCARSKGPTWSRSSGSRPPRTGRRGG